MMRPPAHAPAPGQARHKRWAASLDVHIHPSVPDVLFLLARGPLPVLPVGSNREVIVDIPCANAVLRGADIYAVGVHAAEAPLRPGDPVSVFVDLDGRCLRGQSKRYTGSKVFIGNGHALLGRDDLYRFSPKELKDRGVGVLMTEPIYESPSLNDIFDHGLVLQNLPSILVSHALQPEPHHTILDMCAAPGGKTTHIAALTDNKATIIALDRSKPKILRLAAHVQALGWSSIRPLVCDATACVLSPERSAAFNWDSDLPAPGSRIRALPRESFDRILLDGPCSALGQRPSFTSSVNPAILKHHPAYQRSIFHAAHALLKPGGRLVYSTCTFTIDENERNVASFLAEFPDMELVRHDPASDPVDWRQAAQPGHPSVAFPTEADRASVCRFDPHRPTSVVLGPDGSPLELDTIGFFFAVFRKHARPAAPSP
ncbi:hypothetical protein HK105_207610 [Polyrhizophydium stewartii]|uniref:SAM-dependent MTase RsmB/NOP-type domain-containing protein n=1 Tax=Polyrhizophydium stewartii TaxID=2732419 RepID=A0ABR4N087_9FUNG